MAGPFPRKRAFWLFCHKGRHRLFQQWKDCWRTGETPSSKSISPDILGARSTKKHLLNICTNREVLLSKVVGSRKPQSTTVTP